MPRPQISVRAATDRDASALLGLWNDVVAEAGGGPRGNGKPTVEVVRRRLVDLAGDPTRSLLLAVDGTDVVAMAYVATERLTPLHDETAARISYFHVHEDHRRRGVGTALLTAVTAWAEDRSVHHVIVDCKPVARETNRFFARLGFGQLVVQRAVPLAVLRRRLAPAGAEEVLVRRASLRARARGTVASVSAVSRSHVQATRRARQSLVRPV